jgi:enolase
MTLMNTPRFFQVLDSRANPTLRGTITLKGQKLTASVPSGASTGVHEALELRDGGTDYGGKGVLKAVQNAQEAAKQLDWEQPDLSKADEQLLSLDGTKNKERLGANTILCLSMLTARAQAHANKEELYKLLARLARTTPTLPVPYSNVINGGRHAQNGLQLQEFMLVPTNASSFFEATRQVVETTHALGRLIAKKLGPEQTAVGDEGGFAPMVKTAEEALDLLQEAAKTAGHQMSFAIDAAASEFYAKGAYQAQQGVRYSANELTEWYVKLLKKYPIVSLEDPFDQDDFEGFKQLKSRIAQEGLDCQVVGDDLTVTNPERIRQAHQQQACDCLLLKVNQIGSVTEAITAANNAKDYGWNVMVSHRSGETADTFIADLATALGCGQIKLGAPVRGERTEKYNRLLELEAEYGLQYAAQRK